MNGELSRRDAFLAAGAVIAGSSVPASAPAAGTVGSGPDLAGKTVVVQTRNRPLTNPVVLGECHFESQGGRVFLVGVRQPCARHLPSWMDGIRCEVGGDATAQAESSSAVYGVPREVETGFLTARAPSPDAPWGDSLARQDCRTRLANVSPVACFGPDACILRYRQPAGLRALVTGEGCCRREAGTRCFQQQPVCVLQAQVGGRGRVRPILLVVGALGIVRPME